jgi:hypothetical protein
LGKMQPKWRIRCPEHRGYENEIWAPDHQLAHVCPKPSRRRRRAHALPAAQGCPASPPRTPARASPGLGVSRRERAQELFKRANLLTLAAMMSRERVIARGSYCCRVARCRLAVIPARIGVMLWAVAILGPQGFFTALGGLSTLLGHLLSMPE